ncbi:hypothetical protein RRG08_061654 [Elysia crispata]|uniref:Reverse transcriptase domain-containing protein n=1 Tax=Elysia crispata TaxID=231223 RepID=A0AAE1E0J7_9GAST|nr:hypothetical protein RRG08_061654 [Elysia crispata]
MIRKHSLRKQIDTRVAGLPEVEQLEVLCGSSPGTRLVNDISVFVSCLVLVNESVGSEEICLFVFDSESSTESYANLTASSSTESALLRVANDILRYIDNKKYVLWILLDLSAAFDTMDHDILLARAHSRYGIDGKALYWLNAYLKDRTQTVSIDNNIATPSPLEYGVPQGSVLGPLLFTMYTAPVADIAERHGDRTQTVSIDNNIATPSPLEYGVPQGSVLGPLLFTMYTAPVADIAERHGVNYHLYADDSQLYVPLDNTLGILPKGVNREMCG